MRLEPVPATAAAFMLGLLAACSMKATAPAAPAQRATEIPATSPGPAMHPAPATPPASATPSAPAPPSAVASTPEPEPTEPAPASSTSTVKEQSAKSEAPAPKAATRAVPPPMQQAPKKETAPPATKESPQQAAKPKEQTLDLDSLETRLKETKAIGIMTKIALKNQVDDLLNQFRAFYAGKLKTTLAELRRPYDLLVLKVLSLLQDADPSLAAAIGASREAIWGILSDPVKFADFASK